MYPDPKIVKSEIIKAPAKDVWEHVSNLSAAAELAPSFLGAVEVEGTGMGAVRHCADLSGNAAFKEKVVAWDEKDMTFRYELLEGMVPVENLHNSFRVIELGASQSMVIWTTAHEFVDGMGMTQDEFEGFVHASIDEFIGNVAKRATATQG